MSEYLKREDVRRAVLHNEGDAVIAAIDELPVKKFEEKTGKWRPLMEKSRLGGEYHLKEEWYGPLFKCSICGGVEMGNEDIYCSHCGARMRKADKNDT